MRDNYNFVLGCFVVVWPAEENPGTSHKNWFSVRGN